MINKRVGWVVLVILLSYFVSAATLYGTVYDFSLQQASNVRVTIDTQQVIAVNGRYSFTLPSGNYTITAEQIANGEVIADASENVQIVSEGSYVRDLILFPLIDTQPVINDSDIGNITIPLTNTLDYLTLGILFFVLIVVAVIYFRVKKIVFNYTSKNEKIDEECQDPLPKDLSEIIEFIRSNDNRITQKEIRQKFAKSEATISLIVADLERRGIIQKVKKGRGNIIILKEKVLAEKSGVV